MADSARPAPASMIHGRGRSVWDQRREGATHMRGSSACCGAPQRTAVTVRASS
jgi:hypothetical protein